MREGEEGGRERGFNWLINTRGPAGGETNRRLGRDENVVLRCEKKGKPSLGGGGGGFHRKKAMPSSRGRGVDIIF